MVKDSDNLYEVARKRNNKKIAGLIIIIIIIVLVIAFKIIKNDNSTNNKINEVNQINQIQESSLEKNNNEISNEQKNENNNENTNNETGNGVIKVPIDEEPVDEPAEPPAEEPIEEPTEEPVEPPVQEPVEEPINNTNTGNKKEFGSNVAFIGDSRTQAFLMYAGLKDVTDYTNIGLMVDTAITKKFITNSRGEKITILDDLAYSNIDTVYIMLGINELGWVYSSIFIQKYEELIDKIHEIKPNCEVIVQSIIPVTKTKSDNDAIYNNPKIVEYNKLIKEMADRKNIQYIDLVPVLADENGNLPEDASTDGIHLNKEYCLKWLECLQNN